MSIHPNSSFPLLASDQADVIQIFLQLMSEKVQSGLLPEPTALQGFGFSSDSHALLFPDEPSDLA